MELMQLFEKVELRLLAVIIDAQFMCHLNFDILFKLQVETNILIYYILYNFAIYEICLSVVLKSFVFIQAYVQYIFNRIVRTA